MAAALMLAGTGSDVGKSLLAAGLCRGFSRRGLRVRPFKPQNMSNNAAVTEDGGEIGRAQALQARACGCLPHTDMNPVLLKPQSDIGSQVVVQGRVIGNAKARDYQAMKASLLPKVMESYQRLSTQADLVIVEGAGSIAEVNLRAADIANMGFAVAADVPVVLVADIDRGGVIASIVGSYELIDQREKALLKGFIINRFRGDSSLFYSGIDIIQQRTGLASFGIVPYWREADKLPAEDAVSISARSNTGDQAIRIAVPVISRIANFDDLDPLRTEPDVSVEFIEPGRALPGNADLVILPGSKATIADMQFLQQQGWHIDIQAHLRRGGRVLGICAGYQMLGQTISDPDGIEGPAGSYCQGLGLLDINTELRGDKSLTQVEGRSYINNRKVYGYEMHVGVTSGAGLERPLLELSGHPEGAISADSHVMGCYLHGLFAADDFRHEFLQQIRSRETSGVAYEQQIETTLDSLAEYLEQHLALDQLLDLSKQHC